MIRLQAPQAGGVSQEEPQFDVDVESPAQEFGMACFVFQV
jgi:hypothetical protein